ncbi:rhamnogalacturonan acetylesterase [Granulicella sp. S156]|uniref:rhamnogalacturonan acetylesterase n=1 Tax=Granulicella sp. S156 TaxID=1747224 RepID=UPI00131C14A4|nr:rhamnogalacturonan acetylesterase [Granulicella sp. S156]
MFLYWRRAYKNSKTLFRNIAVFSSITLALCSVTTAQPVWHFDCAGKQSAAQEKPLSAATIYKSPSRPVSASDTFPAFGFDLGTSPTSFASSSCSSVQPFFFSIAVPDGNYQVTLTLGGPAASTTTVRAESRRLFINQMEVAAEKSRRVTFNVNVRSAAISALGSAPPSKVALKLREIGALDWDEKLTLEFNGDHPSVRSISIQPIDHVPTLYLASDSTVVDQDKEPWAAWGQMLPVFFGPRLSIANEAESGETIRSFVGEHRLAKILSTIRPGDYLMIQFGHNDQKPGNGYVPAATDFKTYLLQYITEARAHGATPILVTPMNRRNFDADGKIVQTLGDYPAAMREVAEQQKLALIDLNAMSKTLFETMGETGTLHAFVHYPANTFPGQTEELKDNTHFNSYGAYELARAIVQNIRDQKLPLARYLRLPIPPFDASHPDAFADWELPPSPSVSAVTPYGR